MGGLSKRTAAVQAILNSRQKASEQSTAVASENDLIAWLDSHINLEATAGKVTGLSLERMFELAAMLGDPHKSYPTIHITGTNGKGSTAYLITRLLLGQGLSVGTYSSPHVERVNERLCLNSQPIPDEALQEVLSVLRHAEDHAISQGQEPFSWFELLTAAAFWWFADEAVDVAVIEVGKLGRYDATNVIDSDIAVVTNVSEDHTDGRGSWREAIAWEKAGIISPKDILVLGDWEESELLEDIFLAEKPAAALKLGRDATLVSNELAVGGRLLEIATPKSTYSDLFLSLNGAHQGENAALALLVAETFFDTPLSEEVVEEAFATAALPARLEVLGHGPLVVFDGAHNPRGAQVAAQTVRHDFNVAGEKVLLVGMTQGHNHELSLAVLLGELEAMLEDEAFKEPQSPIQVVCCTAPSPRGIPADELALGIRRLGYEPLVCSEIELALEQAIQLAESDGLVFITGSLYVAGAARQAYKQTSHRPLASQQKGET